MVRILTRLGQVREAEEKYRRELVDFKMGEVYGNLRAIIADEDVEVRAGEVKPVKIKEVSIPANHIVFMCAYTTNPLGHPIAAGEETPLPISMDRKADHATFVAAADGKISRNDLLGVLIILPVELTH